ncbi:MAG: HIT family protein [Rhizobiaceae bacterium]|nr:HIT family protein [Rhizobiaceae bacterium]
MPDFELDQRLARDTLPVAFLGLCDLRLMNDSRWPWLVLVPKRPGITEFHDLTPLDQTMLTFETSLVAKALKTETGADKLNIGTLGNVVPMLHVHVVARFGGDTNWPGPVWGVGGAKRYMDNDGRAFADRLRERTLAS